MNTATAFIEEIVGHAHRRPGAVALRETGGRQLTYAELQRRVDGAATGLHRHGFTAGDPVLFTVVPSIASVCLILAVARAGGTVVAADPRMGAEVFRRRVALARPRWVMANSLVYVLGAGLPLGKLSRGKLPELAPLATLSARHIRVGPYLPGVPRSLSATRLWRTHAGPNSVGSVRRQERAPVAVVFTSGTTAQPKAVVHSDSSLGAGLRIMQESLPLEPDDVVFTSELHVTLPALHAGCTTVIPTHRLRGAALAGELERCGATVAFSVPYELEEVIEWATESGGRLPGRLRLLLLGSAPAYRSFLLKLRAAVQPTTEVWSVYAMTEMLPVTRVGMHEKLETPGDGDLVGAPFPGVQVRTAADGEVLVSGPNLFTGYLGEAPVEELATEDVGRVEGQNLFLLGRRKDMIIRHGENIYPALVEESVMAIPGVAHCRLFGIPSGTAGDERVVLAVEPAAGLPAAELERDIWRGLRSGGRRVDATGLPDEIVIRRLPVDPRSRKVDTAALVRDMLA